MDNKKETPVISEDALAKLQEQMRGMSGGNPAAEEKSLVSLSGLLTELKTFAISPVKKTVNYIPSRTVLMMPLILVW